PDAGALAGIVEQRSHSLPGDVAPLQPAAVVDHQLRVAVAVDQVGGHRHRDLPGQLALGAHHAGQRAGGEEDPVDDVAVADVAEVDVVLAVAAVGQHAHAPL